MIQSNFEHFEIYLYFELQGSQIQHSLLFISSVSVSPTSPQKKTQIAASRGSRHGFQRICVVPHPLH